jgi:hypothetical protein
MKTLLAVIVLVVVAAGTVYTQAPPPSPDLPKFPSDIATGQAVPKPEPTLDQLLDQIEKIRAQKAELEKQEQALAAEVRKKMVKQTERLNKLGLGTPVPPPPSLNSTPAPDLLIPAPILGSGLKVPQSRNQ